MPTMLSNPPIAAELAALPRIDPVIPILRADPFDGAQWIFEPKYEGLRAFLYAAGGRCEIRALAVARATTYAELGERISRILGVRQAVLDGEVVALDARGKPVLRDLLKGRGFPAFAAFDLLWLDGQDLRSLPLAERKRRLADLLPLDTASLYKVFSLAEHGRALFEAARKSELEGIVAKRLSDPYGPDTVWYRIRNPAYRGADGRVDLAAARTRVRTVPGSSEG